jgi:hypothetical protein
MPKRPSEEEIHLAQISKPNNKGNAKEWMEEMKHRSLRRNKRFTKLLFKDFTILERVDSSAEDQEDEIFLTKKLKDGN